MAGKPRDPAVNVFIVPRVSQANCLRLTGKGSEMAHLPGNASDDNPVPGTMPSIDLSTAFASETTTDVRVVARGFSPGRVVFILRRQEGEINWIQWDAVVTDAAGSIDHTRNVTSAPPTQPKVRYEVQVSAAGSNAMTSIGTFDV